VTVRRLLFAALVLLAFALPMEGIVRTWLTRPQATFLDPRFGLVQRPGTVVVQSREGWGRYRANAMGFLDDDPVRVPGGVVGVLVGDSYGQGTQVRHAQRLTEVAEREEPGLSLVNAAEAGRCLIHYALFAPRIEAALHPDVVVVQVNAGDLTDIEQPSDWSEALDEFNARGTAVAAAAEPGRDWKGRLRGLLRRSGLLNMLHARISLLSAQESKRLTLKLTGRKPDLRDVVALPVTPRAAELSDSLLGVVQRTHRRVILLYVPFLEYFDPPVRDAYPERRAFYHELAARHGIPLVDPTDAMIEEYGRTHEPLHGFLNTRPGEGHTNARAHAVMGRLLAEEIRRERATAGALPAGGAAGGRER